MLPLFEQRLRDHLRMRRTDIDRPRHKRKPNGGRPKRNNIEYGENLKQRVDLVIKSFEETAASQPPEFDPALIFKVKTDKGLISEENWRRSNLQY